MKRKTTEQFIEEAKEAHGNFYDYSLTNYVNAKTKVKIICPIHGIFEQVAANHLVGKGCTKCKGGVKLTTEQFIKKAKEIHGEKYDYSLVDYVNNETKVKIICPIHGVFEQTPHDHLDKCGCQKCSLLKSNNLVKTTEQFIEEAKEAHGNFYDYSLTNYVNNHTKVKIICPKHGIFEQKPNNHLQSHGCPKCNSSGGENIIRNYLKEKNILFEEQKRFDSLKNIKQLSYDFFVPEKNLLIEYNGIQHYKAIEYFGGEKQFVKQQKNDKLKKEFAEKNNFNLLVIKYNEDIKEKIKKFL